MGEAQPVGTDLPVTRLGCSDQRMVGYAAALTAVVIRLSAQYPAAKLLAYLPEGE